MSEKDARLSAFCRERGCDGVWLRRRANIAWLADGADVHCDDASDLGVASIIWTPNRRIVITDSIEAGRLREEEFSPDWEFEVADWWSPHAHALPASLRGLNLLSDWPDDCLTGLRTPLTDGEIDRYRELGRDSAEAMNAIMKSIERGDAECEVAGRLTGAMRARGIHAPVVLIAADERLQRYRHPIPTDLRVERTMMVALCARRHGLIVSLTRLVHFGALPQDLRKRHDAVCAVDAALQAASVPGARWCDAFDAAVRTYAATGFPDEWRLHHQGGPMGYQARDFKAAPDRTDPIKPRQAIGWNPSITGTKSEDTLLVYDGSAEGGAVREVLTGMDDWPVCPAQESRPDILLRRG